MHVYFFPHLQWYNTLKFILSVYSELQEFEEAPGIGDGQGSLVCCSLQGDKELDTTEWLNWTELMVFPVVMYKCESWTIKKAERQRIDAFELWY